MHACLHGQLQSAFGWGVAVTADTNPRFLRNFPMQANGAEMLRLACCLATENGVMVCAPHHDALLIEAPLEELADAIKSTEAAMAEASEVVPDGFPLRTSAKSIRYPDHYPPPESEALWSEINPALAQFEKTCEPTCGRNASRASARRRAAGVSFEDRQDLLGHVSGRITTHYSAAELARLLDAANKVCETDERKPELVVLRGLIHRQFPQKSPQGENINLMKSAKPLKYMVPRGGIEPPTRGFSVKR